MRISGGDSYWAEEIVQRTFVRLWEIHDQVSPDKSLISYLCTIAKNLLMNVYQRQTVEYIYAEYVLESSEEYSDNADGELDGKLLEEYIDRLAEELPPFFHISASNTRKLPNGIFEAITSKLPCSRCWSAIVSKPAVTVSALSYRSDRISPVRQSFSKA